MRLELERMWFPTLKVRQLTGHVQGVAVHLRQGRFTVFTSVSDFPRGWGGLLINDNLVENGMPVGMESSSLPQGNHPGGIGIVDDLLVVPIEGGRFNGRKRVARLYVYDIEHPFYPVQITSLSELSENGGLTVLDQDPADSTKASAAGIAPLPGADGKYLIVVLSQGRYLRFIELDTTTSPPVLTPKRFLDARQVYPDDWPKTFTDNVSLVVHDGQIHMFLFSVKLLQFPRWVRVPGYGQLPPLLPRHNATHTVSTFRVEVEPVLGSISRAGTALVPGPSWSVILPKPNGLRDWLRPGFRWGASVGLHDGELGLVTAEYFGNERSKAHGVQYLQFATNFPDTLDWPNYDQGVPGTGDRLKSGLATRQKLLLIALIFFTVDLLAWILAVLSYPIEPDFLLWLQVNHAYAITSVAAAIEQADDIVAAMWDWVRAKLA